MNVRRKQPPSLPSLGSLKLVQLLYEPQGAFLDVQVDLLIADSPNHQTALARRTPIDIPGVQAK
jgi:hypothetical protein